MRKIKIVILVVLIVFITGCATTNTEVIPASVDGRSIVFVKDTFLNYPKANGSIRKIDGDVKSTFWSLEQTHVAEIEPGEHTVEVAFYSKGVSFGGEISGKLEAGQVYEIVGVIKRGRTAKISLVNVGRPEEDPLFVIEVEGYYR